MRGATTQVSNPKISTACKTALKQNLDTSCAAPSLLRMCNTLLQNFLARNRFFTNYGQSSSAAEITRPRYLKEVTISWGRS